MAKLNSKFVRELNVKGLLLTSTSSGGAFLHRAFLLAMLNDSIGKTTKGAGSDLLSGNGKRADKRVREAVVSFGRKGEDKDRYKDRNVVVSMRDDVADDIWYTVFLNIRAEDTTAYYENMGIKQNDFRTVFDFVSMLADKEKVDSLSNKTVKRLKKYKIFTNGSKRVGDKPAAYPSFKNTNSVSPSGSLKKWDIKLEDGEMYTLNPSMFLLACFRGISPEDVAALLSAKFCIEHIHRSEPGREVEEQVFDLSNLQLAPSSSFNSRLSSLRPWDR